MPPEETMTLEQLERRLQIETQIRDDMNAAQQWDGADPQTVEERKTSMRREMIKTNRERNKKLLTNVRYILPEAEISKYEQHQEEEARLKSAKRSESKHFFNNAKKRKEVRKNCPYGDESGYDIHESLNDLRQKKSNSRAPYLDSTQTDENSTQTIEIPAQTVENPAQTAENSTQTVKIDWRQMKCFSHGYRLNSEGNPATEEDEAAKVHDDGFIQSWMTGKLQDRIPYLIEITEWMMNLDLRPAMASEYYTRKHADELAEITDRLVYFTDLRDDPINKDFFNALREDEKRVLDIRLNQGVQLTGVATFNMAAKGVRIDSGQYENDPNSLKSKLNARNKCIKDFKDDCSKGQRDEVKVFYDEADEKAKEYFNEHRTPVSEDAVLAGSRMLFYDKPEIYEANREVLQKIYRSMYEKCELCQEVSLQREGYEALTNLQGTGYADRRLASLASIREKSYKLLEDEYRQDISAYQNAIASYMNGEKLTKEGRRVLREIQGSDKT